MSGGPRDTLAIASRFSVRDKERDKASQKSASLKRAPASTLSKSSILFEPARAREKAPADVSTLEHIAKMRGVSRGHTQPNLELA